MRSKNGSEMSRLLWSFTIPVLLLVAIIIGFFLVQGIVNANNSAKHTKQLLVDQTVESYKRIGENFQSMNFSMDLIKLFHPDIVNAVLAGNVVPLYGLAKGIMSIASPAKYVAVLADGQIKDQTANGNSTVDTSKLPTSPPPGDYKLLDSFEGKKGSFVDVFYPIDLSKVGAPASKFYVSAVFDLTNQIKDINKYFNDQKQNTIIRLSVTAVIALILFGLLSTFWLRYLINKYIRKPVDELNTMAADIAAGNFQGEVVVDRESDFAALQGLLKSGQLILRKFDEKMDEQS
jgi:methyl-accepting chemotaxis protein